MTALKLYTQIKNLSASSNIRMFKLLQGLPLHIQIDTFEDPRDTQVYSRAYCQIKVFCDKVRISATIGEIKRAYI